MGDTARFFLTKPICYTAISVACGFVVIKMGCLKMEHFTPLEAPIHETQRLPVMPPPQIIGRNRELGQIYSQIRAGAAVLLHGPDGLGKSALAATLSAAFTTLPGGVLWWSVDNDSLPQLIARLGRAYGNRILSDNAHPDQEMDAIKALLARDSKPTIVLDGRLDLEVARDFVRKVVPGIPVIMTNEEGGPGPWMPFEIAPLDDDDAVELFIQATADDQVSRLVRADIRGICNALGGQPLVITLAARHVRVTGQTPGEFLGSLTTTAGLPGAMLGLNSIFHHLPDALQGMLLTIGSTFAGTASGTLLETLQLSPEETVVRVMDMLVARGLVQRLPSPEVVRSYRVHSLIRRFARDWLRDTGRLESTLDRVWQGILDYAEQHAGDSREARSQLIAEMRNMMGLAHHAAAKYDLETVRRLALVLQTTFGHTGGYGYELRELARLVGETPERVPTEEEIPGHDAMSQMALFAEEELPFPAEELVQPEADVIVGAPPPIDGKYDTMPLEPYDEREADAGPLPESEPLQPLAFDAFLTSEDEPVESALPSREPEEPAAAEPFSFASWVRDEAVSPDDEFIEAEEAGWYGEDVGDLLAAADEARDSGRMDDAAQALNLLGQRLLDEDRPDEAQEAFAEALVIYEDVDDAEGMLLALEGLAGISLDDGDQDKAIVYASRAENLAAQMSDPARHGHLLALLGDVQLEIGELDNAIATYVNAIETLQATGDELSLGIVQTKLGNAHLDREDFTQAVTMLTKALGVFEREERLAYQGRVLGNLGTVFGRMGQWQEAEGYHRQAAVIAAQLGDVEEQERQLANLAFTAQARGDREAMMRYYRQALDLAYRAEEVIWQVRYLDVLGRMLMDDVSRVGLAVMVLEEADGLVPNDERIRWLKRAQRRLERIESSDIPQLPLPESIRQWAAEAASESAEV